jgi:AcrR family transcriptional regulator
VLAAPSLTTYDRIMDAALELFLSQGVHGTAVTDIERAVGLAAGRGSFYKHFKSKDELLAAVIQREVSRRMAEASEARADFQLPDDPHGAMRLSAQMALADMERFSDLFRLMISEGDRVPQLREIFTQALRHSAELGDWIDDATRYVVIAALVGYHCFRLTAVNVFTDVDANRFVDALAALVPGTRPPGVGPSRTRKRTTGQHGK